jgi:integrase
MVEFFAPGERKGNKFIIARGYVGGVRLEISTRTTNPRVARRVWRDFAAREEASRRSRSGAPRTFRDIGRDYIAAGDIGPRDRRWLDLLNDTALPDGTRFGDLEIGAVLPMHITQAAKARYPEARNETRNRAVIVPAAAVLHFAAANKLRDYLRVPKLEEDRPRNRRPAEGTLQKLIGATDGLKRLFVLLIGCQGWRVTETLGLEAEGIHLAERTLSIWVGKVRREKTVVMHPEVFEAIANMALPSAGRIFKWKYRQGVYAWLRPLCAELGIVFTPHMARHEYATALHASAGAGPADLVGLGTWTSPRSTERYTHAIDDHHRAMAAKLKVGK